MRICSLPDDREKRFSELKNLLLSRDYKSGAIERARKVPRTEALKKVIRPKNSQRPVFVINYDPRLPSVTQIARSVRSNMWEKPIGPCNIGSLST